MAKTAGDYESWPHSSYRGERITSVLQVAIGADGAPTATSDNAGVSITRDDTGVYDLVYPACNRCHIEVQIVSADATVAGWVLLAKDSEAGTAQIRTFLATPGTAVDPADGDELSIRLDMDANPNA